ncbi:MAG: hypothetical protein QXT86_08800 [Archaeoglobaceae archaeon]
MGEHEFTLRDAIESLEDSLHRYEKERLRLLEERDRWRIEAIRNGAKASTYFELLKRLADLVLSERFDEAIVFAYEAYGLLQDDGEEYSGSEEDVEE